MMTSIFYFIALPKDRKNRNSNNFRAYRVNISGVSIQVLYNTFYKFSPVLGTFQDYKQIRPCPCCRHGILVLSRKVSKICSFMVCIIPY